jgi:hypothetical protein
VLEETEDEAADRARVEAVVACLREFPGEDPVRLRVLQADGQEIALALPSARACEELRARLAGVVGERGRVEVENQASLTPTH